MLQPDSQYIASQLESGEFLLLNTHSGRINPIDDETLKEKASMFQRLSYYGKDGKCDLFALIKEKGFQNEYCLIKDDEVVFRCETLEAVRAYKLSHPTIHFLIYVPLHGLRYK